MASFKSSSYDPETLRILQKAFDEACRELQAAGTGPADDVRSILASRIMDLAAEGIVDAERLKRHALSGFQRDRS